MAEAVPAVAAAAAISLSKGRPGGGGVVPRMLRADGGEPQLQDVCTNDSDRMILRNVIYTIWAIHRAPAAAANAAGGAGGGTSYLGYNVRRIRGRGYMVIAFFGAGYTLALQDLQIVMDVSPLRIDSVLIREPRDDDFASPESPAQLAVDSSSSSSSTAAPPGTKNQSAVASSSLLAHSCQAALCITVLDANQPVQITESEVVRIRKRSRGLFSLGSLLGYSSR